MAINALSSIIAPNDLSAWAAMVLGDIKTAVPDPAVTSARIQVVALAGSLDGNGTFSPGANLPGSAAQPAATNLMDNADAVAVQASANGLKTVTRNTIFNGTSWDRQKASSLSARVASSAAAGNPAFLKASAGYLRKFFGLNGAAITYLQIYNKASAPVIGTDTPILTYPVAANGFFSELFTNGGLYFATGMAYAFTTDAAGTTGAAAAAVSAFGILGA